MSKQIEALALSDVRRRFRRAPHVASTFADPAYKVAWGNKARYQVDYVAMIDLDLSRVATASRIDDGTVRSRGCLHRDYELVTTSCGDCDEHSL